MPKTFNLSDAHPFPHPSLSLLQMNRLMEHAAFGRVKRMEVMLEKEEWRKKVNDLAPTGWTAVMIAANAGNNGARQ